MVIVVAVDDTEHANKILERSAELAKVLGEELHILHVMTQSRFVELEATSVDETGQPLEMDRIREVAASVAADAAEDAGLDDFEIVGRVGDPSKEIVNYASNVDASYVVIGGRKRSPAGKAVFGSVTQSTLLSADQPVVVVMRAG